ncbi:unnamed protein product [Sphagnum jensenii]|uniref:Uncharacterized protein n=1 Tax=Sphagnum jensenii TaxID=128206 RepID=A0ABP0W4Z6_9BRYO
MTQVTRISEKLPDILEQAGSVVVHAMSDLWRMEESTIVNGPRPRLVFLPSFSFRWQLLRILPHSAPVFLLEVSLQDSSSEEGAVLEREKGRDPQKDLEGGSEAGGNRIRGNPIQSNATQPSSKDYVSSLAPSFSLCSAHASPRNKRQLGGGPQLTACSRGGTERSCVGQYRSRLH